METRGIASSELSNEIIIFLDAETLLYSLYFLGIREKKGGEKDCDFLTKLI